MYSPLLQLIIGTLLGIGFLTVSIFVVAVCFVWIMVLIVPTAWRAWSLWKAFRAYRRGESLMVAAASAISPRAAFWLPRLSAVVFHLFGRPSPPNWRASTPPSFAEAAHLAQNEAEQREGVPNEGWIRQAQRDRMMATRNEPQPQSSNVSYDGNRSQMGGPPPVSASRSLEAAEGGVVVEAAISAIQFIQNATQQLINKLHDYRYRGNEANRHSSSNEASFKDDHPSIIPPPSQTSAGSVGVKRRHPYPQFHEDPQHFTTPQPSAPPS